MENLSARIFLEEIKGSSFFQSEGDDFLGLKLFSNKTLAATVTKEFQYTAGNHLIIMPVTGELIYKDTIGGDSVAIDAGQVLHVSSPASFQFTIYNPFDDYEINFLLLEINSSQSSQVIKRILDFDLNELQNKLQIINTEVDTSFKLAIGRFAGRTEETYILNKAGLFCFVISGAFEVQGRLLHPKDGLAVWNAQEVELEALSNNATILTIELPYI